jgi:hypothetical protein
MFTNLTTFDSPRTEDFEAAVFVTSTAAWTESTGYGLQVTGEGGAVAWRRGSASPRIVQQKRLAVASLAVETLLLLDSRLAGGEGRGKKNRRGGEYGGNGCSLPDLLYTVDTFRSCGE